MVKAALHHLRALDAQETGILVPPQGLPRPVVPPQASNAGPSDAANTADDSAATCQTQSHAYDNKDVATTAEAEQVRMLFSGHTTTALLW